MTTLSLAVAGANGRMGRVLIEAIAATPGVSLASAFEPKGSSAVGQDSGMLATGRANGIVVSDDAEAAIAAADGLVDFTIPAASVAFAGLTARMGKVHVIGTTGFSTAEEAAIASAGTRARIVKSGNFSLGVNLLAALVKQASAALDEDFDIEVVEMHHNQKIDAPSGTALLLGEAAAAGRGVALTEAMESGRHGHMGKRRRGAIGFAALRGGTVVGEHTVILAGPTERLVLGHVAQDRGLFARGALKAALFARTRPPGVYSMADVLGLS